MNKVIVIAEAGVNHNGDLELAKELVRQAAVAGADYVKFQTYITEHLVTLNAPKAEYQYKNDNIVQSQYEMLKKLELSFDDTLELKKFADTARIGFLSTGFDLESIGFLKTLNIPFFKIPSGEITNYTYLKQIASFKMPIIMSTGMATMKEIEEAFYLLIENGMNRNDITILHCSTEYPTSFENVNLLAMRTIQQKFKTKVGYSDHTVGIEIPIAAVSIGAQVIEKHFTLNKKMQGPDHAASIEPDELKQMIKAIRNIEKALGDGFKVPSAIEEKNKIAARKSIVVKKTIKKGDVFSDNNLEIKRPGNGISPMKWPEIIGKISSRDHSAGDLLII